MSQSSSSSPGKVSQDRDGPAPSWLGKTIGRFELLGLLGRGAYGRVFLAEDQDLRRRVALKVVTADAAGNAVRRGAAEETDATPVDDATAADFGRHAVEQMAREARIAARLEHPGITTIFEVGVVPGRDGMARGSFIAMELADGGTLQELIDTAGPLDVDRACRLAAEAAEALQFAHDAGVLHRDVKPGNLMLSRTGRCKLADFGLAYVDDPADAHHYSRIVGTPAYAAPEIVLGKAASAASDQYSLGCTLFALLTGRPPYVGKRSAVLDAHATKPPADPLPARPDLDPKLAKILRKAMAKDPGDRFESVGQLGAALRPFAADADEPLKADPSAESTAGMSPLRAATSEEQPGEEETAALASMIDRADRVHLLRRRRRNRLLLAAAVVALLAGGIAWAMLLLMRDRPALQSASAPPMSGGDSTVSAGATPPTQLAPMPSAPEDRAEPAASVTHQRPHFGEEADAASADVTLPGEGEVISALDYDRLLALAKAGETATVGGTVSYARMSRSGEVFRVYFEGNDRGRAFALVWFPTDDVFERMEEAFGGTNGSGLLRKTIRATGELSVFNGRPQLVITDPSQVKIVSEDPQEWSTR